MSEALNEYKNYDDLNEEELDTPIVGVDESELKNYATNPAVLKDIKKF